MDVIDQLEVEFKRLEEGNKWLETFMDLKIMPNEAVTFSNAKHSMNLKYNRYRDILPYDHTRVKLKGMNDTDYINANYVECKKANRIYILAQAPLSITREHFWQMIWEQNSLGVIMLNRLFEKGTPKCEMYYPNLDEENAEMTLEFGKFRLTYESEKTFKDFSIRTLECENLEQKVKRRVYHCHFSNWPDFGEPDYPTTFLMFLLECEQLGVFNKELYGPCVVHCSAGVGRSGTFVLVDSMLQILKKCETYTPMAVFDVLNEMRNFRIGLVQTPQQLRFAYRAIIEGLKHHYGIGEDEDSATTTTSGAASVLLKTNGHTDELTADDDSSQQTTTTTTESMTSASEEVDEGDSSDEDDDEDFYEGEDMSSDDNDDDIHEDSYKKRLKTTEATTTAPKRPGTAKPAGKVAKLKLGKRQQNRIKQLRMIQMQNRLGERGESTENLIKTAVARVEREQNSVKVDKRRSREEDVEAEEEERPFDRRDVQTVKVNQPREPLMQKLAAGGGADNDNEQSSTGKRPHSEREARLAELVRSMHEKQVEHEKRQLNKSFLDTYRPLIICGGVLIGGIVLQQIFKRIFY